MPDANPPPVIVPDPPPQQSDPQRLQAVKFITGAVLALACLAALMFEKRLGADFGEVGHMTLFGCVAGFFGLSAHGAYKMTPGGQ